MCSISISTHHKVIAARSAATQALVSLDAGSPAGPAVKVGRQLSYTGLKLREPASGKLWAVVLSDDGGLWKFPAAELGYCSSGEWAILQLFMIAAGFSMC